MAGWEQVIGPRSLLYKMEIWPDSSVSIVAQIQGQKQAKNRTVQAKLKVGLRQTP